MPKINSITFNGTRVSEELADVNVLDINIEGEDGVVYHKKIYIFSDGDIKVI